MNVLLSSNDFAFGSIDQVVGSLTNIVTTSAKSPGAITLQHEISDPDVQGFISVFPSIASSGWKFESLARALNDGTTYQNANSSTSDVTMKGILLSVPTPTSSTATPTVTTSAVTASATQKASSSSSPLFSHESLTSRLFLSFIIIVVCSTL